MSRRYVPELSSFDSSTWCHSACWSRRDGAQSLRRLSGGSSIKSRLMGGCVVISLRLERGTTLREVRLNKRLRRDRSARLSRGENMKNMMNWVVVSLAGVTALAALPAWAGSQQNAARSAQQYLSISGFSRVGLIHQLSSDAGDGYDVADATAAVDSLTVDWNEQATRSAKQYLSISGFSCKGLIHQLSSSAGDGYTASQAAYGAKQAGACE